jgi:error-prone DNA polymerase
MLNNQPMGFYPPAILIKDAQRHGLRVLPVDVTKSDWDCTLEIPPVPEPGRGSPARSPERFALRLGLRYARGLREEAGRAIVSARPFTSIDDLALRVPELRKNELSRLAEIGALNGLEEIHRRDALWQAQRAALPVGPLLAPLEGKGDSSPLARMSTEERLWADYRGTGLTVGKHPMAYRRAEMDALGVIRAADLERIPDGRIVRIAGAVIVRQRPGTANGFVFLSMEDETGIMNAIVTPDAYDRYKFEVLASPFLIIDGALQNQDGVVSVKAARIAPLRAGAAAESHDFH